MHMADTDGKTLSGGLPDQERRALHIGSFLTWSAPDKNGEPGTVGFRRRPARMGFASRKSSPR